MKKDEVRRATDKILNGLEKDFKKAYQKAYFDASIYFKKKLASIKAGLKGLEGEKLIAEQKRLLLLDKQAKATLNYLAKRMSDANADCIYMVKDGMADSYSIAYNFQNKSVEEVYRLSGEMFSTINKETVLNLMENDPFYLPYPTPKRTKMQNWYGKKINAVILDSIERGDSIDTIAKALKDVTSEGYKASVRNARTYITASENQGRYDRSEADKEAFKKHGYTIRKKWIGTNDGRERPSHVMCNNTYANPRTGKFLNGLRFPADPNGEPSEIWNCRCTLVEEVVKDEELQG